MDDLFLRQLLVGGGLGVLSGGGLGLAQVAVVIGLFLAAIYQPERILSRGLFRWACVLLALSFIVPTLLNALILPLSGGPIPMRGGGSGTGPWLLIITLSSAIGPVLFGLSLVFALFAMVPRRSAESRVEPPRHPLE